MLEWVLTALNNSIITCSTFALPSLENALGYYVYVEASQGKTSDLATLAGPMLKQASATCTLTFWYHMYGTSIGDLNVYLVNGYRLTLLWTLSGNQGENQANFFLLK